MAANERAPFSSCCCSVDAPSAAPTRRKPGRDAWCVSARRVHRWDATCDVASAKAVCFVIGQCHGNHPLFDVSEDATYVGRQTLPDGRGLTSVYSRLTSVYSRLTSVYTQLTSVYTQLTSVYFRLTSVHSRLTSVYSRHTPLKLILLLNRDAAAGRDEPNRNRDAVNRNRTESRWTSSRLRSHGRRSSWRRKKCW